MEENGKQAVQFSMLPKNALPGGCYKPHAKSRMEYLIQTEILQ